MYTFDSSGASSSGGVGAGSASAEVSAVSNSVERPSFFSVSREFFIFSSNLARVGSSAGDNAQVLTDLAILRCEDS